MPASRFFSATEYIIVGYFSVPRSAEKWPSGPEVACNRAVLDEVARRQRHTCNQQASRPPTALVFSHMSERPPNAAAGTLKFRNLKCGIGNFGDRRKCKDRKSNQNHIKFIFQ